MTKGRSFTICWCMIVLVALSSIACIRGLGVRPRPRRQWRRQCIEHPLRTAATTTQRPLRFQTEKNGENAIREEKGEPPGVDDGTDAKETIQYMAVFLANRLGRSLVWNQFQRQRQETGEMTDQYDPRSESECNPEPGTFGVVRDTAKTAALLEPETNAEPVRAAIDEPWEEYVQPLEEPRARPEQAQQEGETRAKEVTAEIPAESHKRAFFRVESEQQEPTLSQRTDQNNERQETADRRHLHDYHERGDRTASDPEKEASKGARLLGATRGPPPGSQPYGFGKSLQVIRDGIPPLREHEEQWREIVAHGSLQERAEGVRPVSSELEIVESQKRTEEFPPPPASPVRQAAAVREAEMKTPSQAAVIRGGIPPPREDKQPKETVSQESKKRIQDVLPPSVALPARDAAAAVETEAETSFQAAAIRDGIPPPREDEQLQESATQKWPEEILPPSMAGAKTQTQAAAIADGFLPLREGKQQRESVTHLSQKRTEELPAREAVAAPEREEETAPQAAATPDRIPPPREDKKPRKIVTKQSQKRTEEFRAPLVSLPDRKVAVVRIKEVETPSQTAAIQDRILPPREDKQFTESVTQKRTEEVPPPSVALPEREAAVTQVTETDTPPQADAIEDRIPPTREDKQLQEIVTEQAQKRTEEIQPPPSLPARKAATGRETEGELGSQTAFRSSLVGETGSQAADTQSALVEDTEGEIQSRAAIRSALAGYLSSVLSNTFEPPENPPVDEGEDLVPAALEDFLSPKFSLAEATSKGREALAPLDHAREDPPAVVSVTQTGTAETSMATAMSVSGETEEEKPVADSEPILPFAAAAYLSEPPAIASSTEPTDREITQRGEGGKADRLEGTLATGGEYAAGRYRGSRTGPGTPTERNEMILDTAAQSVRKGKPETEPTTALPRERIEGGTHSGPVLAFGAAGYLSKLATTCDPETITTAKKEGNADPVDETGVVAQSDAMPEAATAQGVARTTPAQTTEAGFETSVFVEEAKRGVSDWASMELDESKDESTVPVNEVEQETQSRSVFLFGTAGYLSNLGTVTKWTRDQTKGEATEPDLTMKRQSSSGEDEDAQSDESERDPPAVAGRDPSAPQADDGIESVQETLPKTMPETEPETKPESKGVKLSAADGVSADAENEESIIPSKDEKTEREALSRAAVSLGTSWYLSSLGTAPEQKIERKETKAIEERQLASRRGDGEFLSDKNEKPGKETLSAGPEL